MQTNMIYVLVVYIVIVLIIQLFNICLQIVTNGFLLTASSSAFMPVIMAKEDHDPKIVRPRDLPIYPEESEVKKS